MTTRVIAAPADAQVHPLARASASTLRRGEGVDRTQTNALGDAQAVVDRHCGPDNWTLAAAAKALLAGYDAAWRHANCDMVLQHVEAELVAPLASVNPPVESDSWQIGGRLDKVVCDDHGTCLYDHKTTSQVIDDPNGLFWRSLQVDSQHRHYELLAWLNGIQFDRIVWDVVRKPTIRPRRLRKSDLDALSTSGKWHGTAISDEALDEAIQAGRENVELFGARVKVEVLKEPQRYFARRTVVRSRGELADYADELFQVGQSMQQARTLGRHYRNAAACFQYGAPCEYLELCSGHDREDSDNWQRTSDVHRELETVEDGSNLITHSRQQCFLTCRRKHYYRYELGLDRAQAAERQSLFFGRLWHAALDVYWQLTCQSETEAADDRNTSPEQAPTRNAS